MLAFLVFIVTSLALLLQTSNKFLVEVPRHGGELSEGVIGRPRFINPVIAKSDADRDMTALIYSGLLRATADGTLIPDMAETYTISPDGLTYTFTLREELVWHDGKPITSEDILFTIEKVRDPGLAIKSPRRASWEGVAVSTPDARTVVFQLKQPYIPFLDNATMGIIPKHVWENVPNEEFDVTYHNIEPIGSGPYRMGTIVEDKARGLPAYYDLIAFKRYALGEPYITHLRITFFGNNKELAQAYEDHAIDQMGAIDPELADELTAKKERIIATPLPRTFAAYFNQNQQPIFVDRSVRQALAVAVDKERIVNEVLRGYGVPIDEPLPPFLLGEPNDIASTTSMGTTTPDRISNARALLEKAGWTLNAAGVYEKVDKKKKLVTLLAFSIAIPDVPELVQSANLLKSDWEKMGASVTVKIFDPAVFAADVLIPRKYEVLFYGQVVGRTPDLYAYWHSSERNAPGLNMSLYANKAVDSLLEKARKEQDPGTRADLLARFSKEIASDAPAVFVYAPDFLYGTNDRVKGMTLGALTTESERFLDVQHWYVDSERVWKWFVKA